MDFSDIIFLQNGQLLQFEKYPQEGKESLVVLQAKYIYILDPSNPQFLLQC